MKISKISIVNFLQGGELSLDISLLSQNTNPMYSKEIWKRWIDLSIYLKTVENSSIAEDGRYWNMSVCSGRLASQLWHSRHFGLNNPLLWGLPCALWNVYQHPLCLYPLDTSSTSTVYAPTKIKNVWNIDHLPWKALRTMDVNGINTLSLPKPTSGHTSSL